MAKKKTAGIPPTDTAAEKTTIAPRRRAATPRSTPEAVAPAGSQTEISDTTPALMSPPTAVATTEPTYDQIAEAAYLRYLNRGGGDGRDFEDWLEAEQQLKAR